MRNKKSAFIIGMFITCFLLAGFSSAAELPKVRWTVQTTWAKGMLIHDEVEVLPSVSSDMTGGNFVIKVLPGRYCWGHGKHGSDFKGTLDGWHKAAIGRASIRLPIFLLLFLCIWNRPCT